MGSGLGPPDPYWANVSLLIVGNGVNGTTTNIVDSSSNNLTRTLGGNTVISTAQSKYGSGSVYFDGNGDYITFPPTSVLNMGSGDYTFECWVYPTSSARIMLFGLGTGGLSVAINASGNIEVCRAYQAIENTFTAGVVTGQWQYITVTRQGTSLKAFKNGTLLGTQTNSTTYVNATTYIGTDVDGYSSPLAGYLYDFRITKGVCRYTATFTAPTAPLPTYGP